MQEHREALYRMRRGESDRQICRDGVLGRSKLSRRRSIAHLSSHVECGKDPARFYFGIN
jgi:hypothetical protein